MFEGIRFSDYKSFPADKTVEVSHFSRVTMFVGKNNSGKSSIIDVISAACDHQGKPALIGGPEEIQCGYMISKNLIEEVFKLYWQERLEAERYLDSILWCSMRKDRAFVYRKESDFSHSINLHLPNKPNIFRPIYRHIPRENNAFRKISAERNIVPEKAVNEFSLLPDGSGATNLIRRVINSKNYDESIIERKLLNALNEIMGIDAQFESIRVQENAYGNEVNDTLWEVYLQEKGSKRFPLSQSGSGLKTVILVLLNLLVLPEVNGSQYVYGFEELENNLHPALQRRLFEYIYHYACENNSYIFLTTHSHVAINMFFDKKDAELYHVTKKDQKSTIKK